MGRRPTFDRFLRQFRGHEPKNTRFFAPSLPLCGSGGGFFSTHLGGFSGTQNEPTQQGALARRKAVPYGTESPSHAASPRVGCPPGLSFWALRESPLPTASRSVGGH